MKRDYQIKHVSQLSPYIRDVVLSFYKKQEELAVSQERYEDAARWRDASDLGLATLYPQADGSLGLWREDIPEPGPERPPESDFWEGFQKGDPYGPLDSLL
jgi:hypothetical protein